MSKNLRSLSGRFPEDKTLFSALTSAAADTGSVSKDQLGDIAKKRLMEPGTLLGTNSFYDLLRSSNRGKQAYRCKGTSCMLSKHTASSHQSLSQALDKSEIGEMACVGRCYQGGGMQVKGTTLDRRIGDDLPEIVAGAQTDREHIPFTAAASINVFGQQISDIPSFYTRLLQPKEKIIYELETSGLRGRGGAGFPFALKLKTCANATADKKYVVCNADEGDPGAFSDRYLLEEQPHRVLGGMLAVGLACGASHGFLYIRAEYPEAIRLMEHAIVQYNSSILPEWDFQFHIVKGAGSYVCGEETALLNSIEGLRPEVRIRPPYPAQEGLWGKPTLVSNVETLAAIPWILENGGEVFANVGNGKSTGSKLISMDHSFEHPGVYEVDMGLPLDDLIYGLAGGFKHPVKALQVGGPLGGILPIEKSAELTLDFESFSNAGFLLGHAGIIAIPEWFSMLELLQHLFEYMAEESCGKCVPCRMGTRKGALMLKAARNEKLLNMASFETLLETMELGSLCALGGGLPLPARNIMEHFRHELSPYLHGGNS